MPKAFQLQEPGVESAIPLVFSQKRIYPEGVAAGWDISAGLRRWNRRSAAIPLGSQYSPRETGGVADAQPPAAVAVIPAGCFCARCARSQAPAWECPYLGGSSLPFLAHEPATLEHSAHKGRTHATTHRQREAGASGTSAFPGRSCHPCGMLLLREVGFYSHVRSLFWLRLVACPQRLVGNGKSPLPPSRRG